MRISRVYNEECGIILRARYYHMNVLDFFHTRTVTDYTLDNSISYDNITSVTRSGYDTILTVDVGTLYENYYPDETLSYVIINGKPYDAEFSSVTSSGILTIRLSNIYFDSDDMIKIILYYKYVGPDTLEFYYKSAGSSGYVQDMSINYGNARTEGNIITIDLGKSNYNTYVSNADSSVSINNTIITDAIFSSITDDIITITLPEGIIISYEDKVDIALYYDEPYEVTRTIEFWYKLFPISTAVLDTNVIYNDDVSYEIDDYYNITTFTINVGTNYANYHVDSSASYIKIGGSDDPAPIPSGYNNVSAEGKILVTINGIVTDSDDIEIHLVYVSPNSNPNVTFKYTIFNSASYTYSTMPYYEKTANDASNNEKSTVFTNNATNGNYRTYGISINSYNESSTTDPDTNATTYTITMTFGLTGTTSADTGTIYSNILASDFDGFTRHNIIVTTTSSNTYNSIDNSSMFANSTTSTLGNDGNISVVLLSTSSIGIISNVEFQFYHTAPKVSEIYNVNRICEKTYEKETSSSTTTVQHRILKFDFTGAVSYKFISFTNSITTDNRILEKSYPYVYYYETSQPKLNDISLSTYCYRQMRDLDTSYNYSYIDTKPLSLLRVNNSEISGANARRVTEGNYIQASGIISTDRNTYHYINLGTSKDNIRNIQHIQYFIYFNEKGIKRINATQERNTYYPNYNDILISGNSSNTVVTPYNGNDQYTSAVLTYNISDNGQNLVASPQRWQVPSSTLENNSTGQQLFMSTYIGTYNSRSIYRINAYLYQGNNGDPVYDSTNNYAQSGTLSLRTSTSVYTNTNSSQLDFKFYINPSTSEYLLCILTDGLGLSNDTYKINDNAIYYECRCVDCHT